MKPAAIVQARMGSTRLPGKVLADVAGRPLLARTLERLRLARSLGLVGVATTVDPSDDPIALFCAREGVPCHRGPVDDVLGRYVGAADAFGADPVVRITGDCPFVCPAIVDLLVDRLAADGADFATLDGPSVHEGIDPWAAAALRRFDRRYLPADEREHLALLVRRHRADVRVALAPVPPLHRARAGLRLSVDEPADLALARALWTELASRGRPFTTEDLLAVLDRRPELIDLNRHVPRRVPAGIQ
jgi:spore coat polysaccharide biosynthesis protein SpsF (cytidylyltransferase family)